MGQFPEFGNELVSWPFLCVCVFIYSVIVGGVCMGWGMLSRGFLF